MKEIRTCIEKSLTPALSHGRGSNKVLSTKKLTPSQREIISNTNIDIVAYNAISVEKLPFISSSIIENAIVTSQHTAKILIKSKAQLNNVFCVGEKTALLLVKNNYNIVETAKNASVLAEIIAKKHKKDSFVFFCGNKRRKELPRILSENKVSFTEEILYNTTLNLQKFQESFEGVLFFSPSGVESYIQVNSLENAIAFCIGNTTANEARKYTSKIVISNPSSVENVLLKLQEYFS